MVARRSLFAVLATAALVTACGGRKAGPPACGLGLVMAPTVILQRLSQPGAALTDVPRGLPNQLPARVIGQRGALGSVLIGYEGSKLVLGYQGQEFPTDTTYAFGLLVVDDTSQRVVGALIYSGSTVPHASPRIGTVTGGGPPLGLYGVRVSWNDLSNPRCPLLGDTVAAPQSP